MRLLAAVAMLGVALAQQPAFEIISIKPSAPGQQRGGIKPLPGGQTYQAQNLPIRLIFSLMFHCADSQISGGPEWLNTDRWDILAKAAKPSSMEELHLMFQNLLITEFQIQFHKETKQGPVYALVVDKGGPKMKVNTSPETFDIPIRPGPQGELNGTRVPMKYFAWTLSNRLSQDARRPVIDKTGLTGFYDFTLSFLPELAGVERDRLPPDIANRPNLFDALKEQLGLKLEPQKGPVETYVIERAVKPDTK